MSIDPLDMELAKAVRSFRNSKRIKQEFVAARLDISVSSYCRLESGAWAMHFSQIVIIADALGVNPLSIFLVALQSLIKHYDRETITSIFVEIIYLSGSVDNVELSSESVANVINELISTKGANLRIAKNN
jgi:transcriptional regulator with XRE-family HTH domain